MNAGEFRERVVFARRRQIFLLLEAPVLVDERTRILTELGSASKTKLRFHVLVQILARAVVRTGWVILTSRAEAIVSLGESIRWLVLQP